MVRTRGRASDAGGFTLIELMVALLLIGIVMAAMAPTFYGTLRGTTVTNERSVANDLAVQTVERLRSVPYSQVGFATGVTAPATCTQPAYSTSGAGVQPVLAPSPVVNHVHYTVNQCISWAGSSMSQYGQGYKEVTVTVSWGGSGAGSIVYRSAIYQAGTGPCINSDSSSPPGNGAEPAYDVNVSKAANGSVSISWLPPCAGPMPTDFKVLYSSANPNGASIASLSQFTCVDIGSANATSLTLTSGTWFIQVQGSCANSSSSPPSNTAEITV